MKKALCGLTLLGFSSCGLYLGSTDYDYSLPGDCSLRRTSAHQIDIASQSGLLGIPPKVVQLGWDRRFILVQQQMLKHRGDFPGDTYQVPDSGRHQFWIIDVAGTNRIGPLDQAAFLAQRKALG